MSSDEWLEELYFAATPESMAVSRTTFREQLALRPDVVRKGLLAQVRALRMLVQTYQAPEERMVEDRGATAVLNRHRVRRGG